MSTQPQSADFLKEWKVGEEIGFVLDHVTKQDTTAFQINEMFTALQEMIKPYGFSMKMWGLKSNFDQSLNKNLAKDKQVFLEFLTSMHNEICMENGVIEKKNKESIAGKVQELLVQHNVLLEDPRTGELTLNKGGSNA